MHPVSTTGTYPAHNMGAHVPSVPYSFHYDYSVLNHQYAYPQPAYDHQGPPDDYSYPPGTSNPPSQMPSAPYAQETPLHAPVPMSRYSTLIMQQPVSPHSPVFPPVSGQEHASPYYQHNSDVSSNLAQQPIELPTLPSFNAAASTSPSTDSLVYFGNAQRTTLPTPSDLLNEEDAQGESGDTTASTSAVMKSESRQSIESQGLPLKRKTSKPGSSHNNSANNNGATKPQETQRKAYFRAVAEAIGFTPTNPDTISSHDKKRHYLECVEQYVDWLHEQIRILGEEPVPFEKVSKYPGLSHQSIRILLVHMEDEIRKLNQQTLEEEQEFLRLQMQVSMQLASAEAHQGRRHSIATVPDSASSQPFLQPAPTLSSHLRY
ncbi:predicted protein [Postia placenta Mad-698-R]|nr:predicted protein [Postia placenta Mad-698-R]